MCTTPLILKIPKNSSLLYLHPSGFMQVPCGHCVECMQQNTNSWSARICEEFKDYGTAVFFTITYRDKVTEKDIKRALDEGYTKECVQVVPKTISTLDDSTINIEYVNRDYDSRSYPYVSTSLEESSSFVSSPRASVCHEDLQLWIKRFRSSYERKYKKRCPLRYFITEEYGPKTLRPHAHGVLFGLSIRELRPLFKDWQIRYGYARYEVAKDSQGCGFYCAKYSSKGSFENPFCSHYDANHNFFHDSFPYCIHTFGYNLPLCFRPRKLVSQGLGASYLTKEKILWHLDLVNGTTFDMPVYSYFNVKNDDELIDLLYEKVNKQNSKLKYRPRSFSTCKEWRRFLDCRTPKRLNERRYYYFPQRAKQLVAEGQPNVKHYQGVKKTPLPLYYLHRIFPIEVCSILSADVSILHLDLAIDEYRQLSPDTPLFSDDKVMAFIEQKKRLATEDRVRKSLQCNKNFYNKAKV